MGTLSLLHIGDIHYSSEEINYSPTNPRNIGQYNWADLSRNEKSSLIQYLIRQIKKSLFNLIEREHFDAIIFTGDLCRQGSRQGYQDCLNYLRLQFQNFSKKVIQSQLKISSGNHDLCSDFEYEPNNLRRRFIPFCNLLTQNQFSEYATDSIVSEIVENTHGRVILININSCLEFRNISLLPPTRQTAIQLEIENNPNPNLNRLLNFPFLNENIINEVYQIIQENSDCLPVIFTHHNFSHMGGYNPAREHDHILNAKDVCDRLDDLDRSIMIFHGHIHSYDCNVMEIHHGKMIFLSAPLLFPQFNRENGENYGYNVIKIKFADDDLQTPLGCDIHSYTMNGCELIHESERFFFNDSMDMAAQSLNAIERQIYHKINATNGKIFLDELLDNLKTEKKLHPNFSFEQFLSIITNLYWRALIEFKTNPHNPERSKVWRKIP